MLEDFDLSNLREDIRAKPDERLMRELEKRGVSQQQVDAIAARRPPPKGDDDLSPEEEEMDREMERTLAMSDEEVKAELPAAGVDLAECDAKARAWHALDSKMGERSIQHIAAERRKERWRAVQALLDRVDSLPDDETEWN
jgi:hypothetical protein